MRPYERAFYEAQAEAMKVPLSEFGIPLPVITDPDDTRLVICPDCRGFARPIAWLRGDRRRPTRWQPCLTCHGTTTVREQRPRCAVMTHPSDASEPCDRGWSPGPITHAIGCRCVACRRATAGNSPEPEEIVWEAVNRWDGTLSDARFKGLWLVVLATPSFARPPHIDVAWFVANYSADSPPCAMGGCRLPLDMAEVGGVATWDRSQIERARQWGEQEARLAAIDLVQR